MKKTSIGGEALIEGVMMRGPDDIAIAIRKSDGEIIIDKKPLKTLAKKHSFFKLPIIRGAVGMLESMIIGMRALLYSAEFVEVEEEGGKEAKPSKVDAFFEKIFGDKFFDVVIYFSVFISMIFVIGLFMLLPSFLAGLLHFNKDTTSGLIGLHLFEGVIRIVLFVGYIALISNMKDIKRVFQYHGAEHKTIHCYESGQELTVENVKKFTTRHPRCGTAFMFVVMIVSIIVFSFTGWGTLLWRVLSRIILIPLVAGLSYEVIKFAGRSDSRFMAIVSAPGLALQKFTTREPDDQQIEVAITALKNVLVEDSDADKW
ncbi:MAG TPA: DUF1385 domain-containing protein [Pseudobacteroides sp.]|uniref:DUF1385 domain-containing protein n=1 Tax=Pseudobacteroides sp. TaxID=1968840 RepID=UPI002F92A653